jgi:hypothetical protein
VLDYLVPWFFTGILLTAAVAIVAIGGFVYLRPRSGSRPVTSGEAPRRGLPWFGLGSMLAPSLGGLLWLVRGEISDMMLTYSAYNSTMAAEALAALFLLSTLGLTFAILSFSRQEKWRWLAITGLVVNAIMLTLFLLGGVFFMLLGHGRVV